MAGVANIHGLSILLAGVANIHGLFSKASLKLVLGYEEQVNGVIILGLAWYDDFFCEEEHSDLTRSVTSLIWSSTLIQSRTFGEAFLAELFLEVAGLLCLGVWEGIKGYG